MCSFVTGVQTCALPFWSRQSLYRAQPARISDGLSDRGVPGAADAHLCRRQWQNPVGTDERRRRPTGHLPSCGADARRSARTALRARSEEHTSELQSLMRISYAVFCLKKKKKTIQKHYENE